MVAGWLGSFIVLKIAGAVQAAPIFCTTHLKIRHQKTGRAYGTSQRFKIVSSKWFYGYVNPVPHAILLCNGTSFKKRNVKNDAITQFFYTKTTILALYTSIFAHPQWEVDCKQTSIPLTGDVF